MRPLAYPLHRLHRLVLVAVVVVEQEKSPLHHHHLVSAMHQKVRLSLSEIVRSSCLVGSLTGQDLRLALWLRTCLVCTCWQNSASS